MAKTVFFDDHDVEADSTKEKCFILFDQKNKGFLNVDDVSRLLASIVKVEVDDRIHALAKKLVSKFKKDDDRGIAKDGFDEFWISYIRPLLKPVRALLIIDVQSDFIDGSLALRNCPAGQEGSDVIPIINRMQDQIDFDMVVYSLDWHPPDHISFYENLSVHQKHEENGQKASLYDTVTFDGPPKISQKLWPTHCVQNTPGSQLHPQLKITPDSIHIHKGTDTLLDSYSAFFDNKRLNETDLRRHLESKNVTHVFICGLAFDYCVGYTAIDARDLGFATTVIKDATRCVDVSTSETMEAKLVKDGCVMTSADQVENLANGREVNYEYLFCDKVLSTKESV